VNTHRCHPNQPNPADPTSDRPPSVAEIAALTRRLRALSAAGRTADPDERAAFLADKAALLARIPATSPATSDDPKEDQR
jgi:hypothetical protein